MPAAADAAKRFASSRANLRPAPSVFVALLALVALSLSACDGSLTPPFARRAEPSPPPTLVPPPTPFQSRAEAIYSDHKTHPGITLRRYASLPAGAVLPPASSGASERGVTVLLDEGAMLRGELYLSSIQPQPAILILGADLAAWGDLPLMLSQARFAVLALQSDASTQARHVDTMLQSLIAHPAVDASAIGVIGEARAADLVMLGCAVNSLCDALALLSPLSRDTLRNMLASYGQRPLWLAASRSDSESHGTALTLYQNASGLARLEITGGGHGATLLDAREGLAEGLADWMAQSLGRG